MEHQKYGIDFDSSLSTFCSVTCMYWYVTSKIWAGQTVAWMTLLMTLRQCEVAGVRFCQQN